jgi:DNA-binding CsgD family transcriptional regulator
MKSVDDDLAYAAEALTEKQRYILGGLARGEKVATVAADLGISRPGAYSMLNAARDILEAPTITGAVVAALRVGVIDFPEAE